MSHSGGECKRKKAAHDLAQWIAVARRQCIVAAPRCCPKCGELFYSCRDTDRRCPACRLAIDFGFVRNS